MPPQKSSPADQSAPALSAALSSLSDAIDVPSERNAQYVKQLLGSRTFTRSPRLAQFLEYIASCELGGRTDEISEQHIGITVFGRPPGYNPGDDNVVRSYARNLRLKLDEYYRTEGASDLLRVEIPKGAYRPVFVERFGDEVPHSAEQPHIGSKIPLTEDNQPIIPSNSGQANVERSRSGAGGAGPKIGMAQRLWLSPVARYCSVFLLCVISYLAGVRHLISITQSRSHPLWKSLFTRSGDTYIVPADSALLLLEAMKHENVTPDIYERRSFNADPDPAAGFAGVLISHFYTRPYTSMVDLQAIRELTALPESAAANVKVVFARDLHTEQIKSSSVILLGASNANPWVALFDPQMSFHLHYQMGAIGYEVLNSKPSHGEPDRYPYENSDPLHRAYGEVSFLPSLGGKGHVLILQGTTMAGTQAAIDFVLHRDDLLGPVLDAARTSTGNLRPFEVLLQTQNVANSATGVKVISVHLE